MNPAVRSVIIVSCVLLWGAGLAQAEPPAASPPAMAGTTTNSLIFGGRFLKQEVRGTVEGHPPFEGIGITGYDNIRKEYQSVWFDNSNGARHRCAWH